MERQGWGRHLLMALLAVVLSSGLGLRTVPRADAMGVGRMSVGLTLAVRRAWIRPAAESLGQVLQATHAITWTQQAELTSTAQTTGDAYGWAVAVSSNTAVVGAQDTPPDTSSGAVYIFGRSGSTWTQQAQLSDPNGTPNDHFGVAVAASTDTIVVGADGATGSAPSSGAAYVYIDSGGAWTLQATLTATDGAFNDGFGAAVAISGSTVVVGAPAKNNQTGAAYVFTRTGSTWTQQAELAYPGGPAFAEFGNAVAVSGDTAVIAAPVTTAAYIYARNGSAWSLQATLSDPGPTLGRYYGVAVAVSGNAALVSASEGPNRVNGVVYLFGRTGSTWSVQTALTPPAGQTNSSFGESVGFSGTTVVVGGQGAWTFMGRGRTWSAPVQLIPSDRPANLMGAAVAVSGNTALIGATAGNPAAYVFVRSLTGDQAPADDTEMALRPAPRDRVR